MQLRCPVHVSVWSGTGCFQASNLYKNKVLFSGIFLGLQKCAQLVIKNSVFKL